MIFKKAISSILVASIFLSVLMVPRHSVVYAQETTPTATEGLTSQSQQYLRGTQPTQEQQLPAQDVIEGVFVCGAGSVLAGIIAYGLTSLLSTIGEAFGEQVVDKINPLAPSVPITQTGTPRIDSKYQTSKEVMVTFMGIPIAPSWDSIAWCIVNEILRYISEATIAWANNGFEGKPAFLENPERFFKELADMEAASFIEQIAYNTTGVNVCEPFRVEIAIRLANEYGRGLDARRLTCSLSQIGENASNATVGFGSPRNGGFGLQNYWTNYNDARRPENNIWGSYIMANDLLYGQVQLQENTARFEIGLNRGWLNFKKCSNPEDTNSCVIHTPGTLIESTLNKSLGLSKDRLVLAQEFDQMITAVVNGLIRVALDKVLEETQE
jgi:hypothetical protein